MLEENHNNIALNISENARSSVFSKQRLAAEEAVKYIKENNLDKFESSMFIAKVVMYTDRNSASFVRFLESLLEKEKE